MVRWASDTIIEPVIGSVSDVLQQNRDTAIAEAGWYFGNSGLQASDSMLDTSEVNDLLWSGTIAVSNLSAGFGDTISLGGTSRIREQWTYAFDLNASVDTSSISYNFGKGFGYDWFIASGAIAFEAGAVDAVSALGQAGYNLYLTNPESISDFISSMFPGPPKLNLNGYSGFSFSFFLKEAEIVDLNWF